MRQFLHTIVLVSVVTLTLALHAGTAEELPPPTDPSGLNFWQDYQQTSDLTGLYVLTRRALLKKNWRAAENYMALLLKHGWTLGIEDAETLIQGAPTPTQDMAHLLSDRAPVIASAEVAATLPTKGFFAEGISHDPTSGRIFLGSLTRNAVAVIGKDDTHQIWPLPDHKKLVSVYGIRYDANRNQLWVTRNNLFTAPLGEKTQAQLLALDAGTGEISAIYPLPANWPIADLNEITLLSDKIYVTDSNNNQIIELDPKTGTYRKLILSTELSFVNGLTTNGTHLFIAHRKGISRIDVNTGEVIGIGHKGLPLSGIDGLEYANDAFYAVQNAVGIPRILKASLSQDGLAITHVETLVRGQKQLNIPTTGFIHEDHFFFIANSQLDMVGVEGANADLEPTIVMSVQ